MKLIIGLGNPGDEYARTRHNIGRRLVEILAGEEKVSFTSKKSLKAAVASWVWGNETLHAAYPLTYMNLSGEAVAGLVAHFGLELKDILIVVDDVALPFGKLRLRGEGSSGGHNGLFSIEDHLRTQKYPRLRIGIGMRADGTSGQADAPEDFLRDYVLSPFTSSEEKKMRKLLEEGMKACRSWALEPFSRVMNRVNATEL